MLVVNVLSLRTIDLLDFSHQIHLACLAALNFQNAVRVERAFGKRLACLDLFVILYQKAGCGGNLIRRFFALIIRDDDLPLLLFDADASAMLSNDLRVTLGGKHISCFCFCFILDRELPVFGMAYSSLMSSLCSMVTSRRSAYFSDWLMWTVPLISATTASPFGCLRAS